jgi:hypothetical protein
VLSIEMTRDEAGIDMVCELCDQLFVSAASQPRAWIHGDYIGLVCPTCAAAQPNTLLTRIEQPLADARLRVQRLEAIHSWLMAKTPEQKRRSFRLVGFAQH